MSAEDPITARMRELVEKSRRGSCSPAELEELALYRDEASHHADQQQALARTGAQEDGWLARAAQDEALTLEQHANSRRPVRKVGVGLTVAGVIILFVPAAQILGLAALATGAFMLAGSVLVERASQANRDPYNDVDQ